MQALKDVDECTLLLLHSLLWVDWLCPETVAHQASSPSPSPLSLSKFTFIESSSHLIL